MPPKPSRTERSGPVPRDTWQCVDTWPTSWLSSELVCEGTDSGYDFSVEYRPAKLIGATDALSRCEEDASALNDISTPQFQLFDTMRADADSDPR
jgi:hypothetical protein